ncbi:hypothetical protein SAMN05660742_105156 [Propionispira arboris]|uniref:Uncharacterized protein n=1 Tax=Propionispira arboris TaxID=84035 RepID=A0A1H6XJA2_9FIRM|nr:hypothetical protein SAMN05660742_105156 [Propionispira arboris]
MGRRVGFTIGTEMQKKHWMESKRHNPKTQSALYRDITNQLSEFQDSRFIIIMFRKCLDLWYHYNIEKADKIDMSPLALSKTLSYIDHKTVYGVH